MSERFFSSRPVTGDRITLDGPEAHHLLHVMRAAVGDHVAVFDDSGAEFDATITSLRRTEADLRIVDRRMVDRELPFPLVIGVALPKGDRQKWLVEKLTELGVTTLVPLVTERSVAQPAASALERLRRTVVEAAKQCGRNRLMRIAEPQLWSDWIENDFGFRISDFGFSDISARSLSAVADNPKSAIEPRRLIAHPGGLPISEIDFAHSQPTQLAIGPEGGFTDAEVAAAIAAGWQQVSLGPRIMRVETSAIALAAAISLASSGGTSAI